MTIDELISRKHIVRRNLSKDMITYAEKRVIQVSIESKF